MLSENTNFLFMASNKLYVCGVMTGIYQEPSRLAFLNPKPPTHCFDQHYGVTWLHFHTPYNKSWGNLNSVFNTTAIVLITCHGKKAYYGHLPELPFPAFAFPESQSHIFIHYCCTKILLCRILHVSFYLIFQLFPRTKHGSSPKVSLLILPLQTDVVPSSVSLSFVRPKFSLHQRISNYYCLCLGLLLPAI